MARLPVTVCLLHALVIDLVFDPGIDHSIDQGSGHRVVMPSCYLVDQTQAMHPSWKQCR